MRLREALVVAIVLLAVGLLVLALSGCASLSKEPEYETTCALGHVERHEGKPVTKCDIEQRVCATAPFWRGAELCRLK